MAAYRGRDRRTDGMISLRGWALWEFCMISWLFATTKTIAKGLELLHGASGAEGFDYGGTDGGS
jgi:hypothetical protein